MKIGVLALQGGFSKHLQSLKKLGVDALEVRTFRELKQCQGLIIPGGESTVIARQLQSSGLLKELISFSQQSPIFGTCAGLILMSKNVEGEFDFPRLNLFDITVKRNAYGRQIASFAADLEMSVQRDLKLFKAVFIRAPQITKHSKDVKVLSNYHSHPVLIQQNFHLGASFHPELTDDLFIHEYFLTLVKK